MILSGILPQETRAFLKAVPSLIEKTFPIPGRFRGAMPSQIAELSRLLTNRRGGRSLSYLSRPNFLSAYMHYFLPWNLYRLCILLHGTDIALACGNTITDLGSGPLTFVSALWIARPDLRNIPLEINCIDRSAPALEAGKNFFDALSADGVMNEKTGGKNSWKINLVRTDIDIRRAAARQKKQAALVCAVNMFNEIYENLSHSNLNGLRHTADNAARFMHSYAEADAGILTVEPGVPQSGHFISFLRASFMELGRQPMSPCTHTAACPYAPSGKKRWCHFAFETIDAPKELVRLSAAARLPKERLALSYLYTGVEKKNEKPQIRVISDVFALPQNRYGCYGCCDEGLVLLAGEKKRIEEIVSGSLVNKSGKSSQRDAKSGAIIMEVI
ncbi:MAG: small ribosomal subunit Rsm22 family protein [Treponema sp.]|jgi:ribosomal protein RSM22 (predicted rRNA methylase)|nr:small ribosomal subunit Rsm22 family protein [Treponema sp.]